MVGSSFLLKFINKIPWIVYPDPLMSRSFIWDRIRGIAGDKTRDQLVSFNSLPERYQISGMVLWECLLALNIKPQEIDEHIYFTVQNLNRLEQFIKRIEISWACPHILETYWRAKKRT